MEGLGTQEDGIQLESSLVDDLELDSLKFVDLMGAIETAFGIDEFPMQAWVDAELEREGSRFTVAALLDACLREMRGGRDG